MPCNLNVHILHLICESDPNPIEHRGFYYKNIANCRDKILPLVRFKTKLLHTQLLLNKIKTKPVILIVGERGWKVGPELI